VLRIGETEVVEIRKYLLGKATEEECTRVEERLLVDQEYFEQLLVEEDELIDDYLHGGLTGSDKEDFKRVFLAAPERRERFDFARALEQYFNPPSIDGKSYGSLSRAFDWFIFLLGRQVKLIYVGAMVAAAVGITIIAYRALNVQPQTGSVGQPESVTAVQTERDELKKQLSAKEDELRRIEEQLEQSKRDERSAVSTSRQKPPASLPAPPPLVFGLSLINVRSAGSPVTTFEIPSGTGRIRLNVDLENDGFKLYRVFLQTESGQIIHDWQNVRPSFEKKLKNLRLDLPASVLDQGAYLVKLQGIENGEPPSNAGEVRFKVVRK
jgi:hypothetical protein